MNDTEQLQLARGLAELALRTTSPATEKVAAVVADLQPTKQANIDLKQIASNPYLQNALLGAGAGGLIGMLQQKNKRRAALNYAITGGLGGLGLTAARDLFSPTTPPPAVAAAEHDNNIGNAAIGLGGAAAGAAGGRALHSALEPSRLSRFLTTNSDFATAAAPHVNTMRGAGRSAREITEELLAHGVPRMNRHGVPIGTRVTSEAMRGAFRNLPRMPGRFALPIAGAVAGALAVPGLINSLRGSAASE
jgi:hypothetical protein